MSIEFGRSLFRKYGIHSPLGDIMNIADRMLADKNFVTGFTSQVMSQANTSPYSTRQQMIKRWIRDNELGFATNNQMITLLNKMLCSALSLDPFGYQNVIVAFGVEGDKSEILDVYEQSTLAGFEQSQSRIHRQGQNETTGIVHMDMEAVENHILATLDKKSRDAIKRREFGLMYGASPETMNKMVPNDPEEIIKQFNFLKQGTSMDINKVLNVEDKVETKVFIGPNLADNMSDEQIFALIREKERRSSELNMIKNKPKKLLDQLNEIDREIDALVKYVDEREVKE